MSKHYPKMNVKRSLAQSSKLTFEFIGQKTSKVEYLQTVYRFYRKNLAKVTGPNQFSLAVGHRTTAKVDDCQPVVAWYSLFLVLNATSKHLYHFDFIRCIECYFPDDNQKTKLWVNYIYFVILQTSSSLLNPFLKLIFSVIIIV